MAVNREYETPVGHNDQVDPQHRVHGWPPGKRLTVLVNVALEGWSENASPGIGPMGNPLAAAVDLQARSWAEYGPRRGMARLLDLLRRAGVKATVLTSGVVAKRYPDLVAAVVAAGHEVCGHGYAQELVPVTLRESAERNSIIESVLALQEATGVRPTGWVSPRCTPSSRTASLLAESGFQWHADIFDDDLPRVETTAAGKIVAIPFTTEVNDLPLSVRYGQSPEEFVSRLRHVVEGWFARHDNEYGCLDVTVHAHVFGRPSGARALEDALDLVCSQDWIWMPTHIELASHYFPMLSIDAARPQGEEKDGEVQQLVNNTIVATTQRSSQEAHIASRWQRTDRQEVGD